MEQLTLFLISQFAGLVMIVSGVLLIYRQKIYLNPATNDVMEVDIPVFGKIKTNIPAIALFIVGFIPLIYPVYKWQSPLQSLTVVQPW